MLLYNRRCNLELHPANGGDYLSITNLRMTFSVQKSLVSKTGYNKTSVSVTNLSEDHRRMIDTWGHRQGQTTALAKAFLFAGYSDMPMLPLLAKADLYRYRHSFEPPDVITTFESDDGREKGDRMVSVPSKVASTASVPDLLRDAGDQIGEEMTFPSMQEYPDFYKKNFSNGYSNTGKVNDCVTDILEHAECDFSFVDDKPVITPYDSIGKTPGFLISERTGMIGIPERVDDVLSKSGRQKRKNLAQPSTNPGWEVTMLLEAKAVPGSWARLISTRQNLSGDFLIESVTHSGDTHGDEWQSKIRLVAGHAK